MITQLQSRKLKRAQKTPPLRIPTGNGPNIVQTNASASGWGAALLEDGELRRYASSDWRETKHQYCYPPMPRGN